MTTEFDDVHVEALRAADRPHRLGDAARQRIVQRMDWVYDQTSVGASAEPVGAGEVIPLDPAPAVQTDRHPVSRRWLAAAAVAVLLVVALVGLRTGDDQRVDVAGSEIDPALASAVRGWCAGGLDELTAALEAVEEAPEDGGARTAALSALVEAVSGYLDFLLESGIREGSERANEVGRFAGEAASVRNRAAPPTADEVLVLARRFAVELEVTSNRSSVCEVPM